MHVSPRTESPERRHKIQMTHKYTYLMSREFALKDQVQQFSSKCWLLWHDFICSCCFTSCCLYFFILHLLKLKWVCVCVLFKAFWMTSLRAHLFHLPLDYVWRTISAMQSIFYMKKEKLKEMCWFAQADCSDFNCSMYNGRVNKADVVHE